MDDNQLATSCAGLVNSTGAEPPRNRIHEEGGNAEKRTNLNISVRSHSGFRSRKSTPGDVDLRVRVLELKLERISNEKRRLRAIVDYYQRDYGKRHEERESRQMILEKDNELACARARIEELEVQVESLKDQFKILEGRYRGIVGEKGM
ncbi:hypothetical protein P280DRAFT_524136 [Massarina eburnea CBS 473.64]|uniref:Uncharacterized protein n=1 Tax=Massarina eburnea CBS 473.64 TaxID=1395130 RepID=A0A6A6RK36_9PLEO|nr:hypothetical protein P280DRAFT_524136 [Massarina eburnea CBS 473.64]